MEATDKIKETGLKVTPQRKAVYEAMMELHHAPIEAIIAHLQSKGMDMTLSTVYRILDSFCKTGLLSQVYHPHTNQCNYDITVHSHHHLYDGKQIVDYEDPELTKMIRLYLEQKNRISDKIDEIQVQIIVNKSLT